MYQPQFYRLSDTKDRQLFDELIASNPSLQVLDELDGQLRELIKIQNPKIKIKDHEYPELVAKHLANRNSKEYGVWVYYPWANRVLHLLDEEEFTEVRTNRNRYKLTKEEQQDLSTKVIGIIGLSVGQSIALTIATERICGELRLADFDTVELSNLNRIRTGLHNLGLKKTVIAAREIWEIDPFLKVKLFDDGITAGNIDEFFTGERKLDMLIEVCDGLDIKIQSRFKARALQIPVVMDTNDRGMLDVERFDLEPDRPILHGLAGDLNPDKIKDLTNEEKIPYILKMVGAETISTRLKASMMEVEQSINTWPQLASSVVLGGALTTDTARRILLGQFTDSGRYYIDFDELIKDRDKEGNSTEVASYIKECPPELKFDDLVKMAATYSPKHESIAIDDDKLKQIVNAACAAPSGGNAQPWKFIYHTNRLFIFHDLHYSHSLLDYKNLGSYLAFGAMFENIALKAAELGLSVNEDIKDLNSEPSLVAVISFSAAVPAHHPLQHLSAAIGTRVTNRVVLERKLLKDEDKEVLSAIASTIQGAHLQVYENMDEIKQFCELLTDVERLRVMHPQGHYDTFVRELRFTKEQVETTADGLDIATLNMSNGDKAAMQIASDADAMDYLHQWKKGEGFRKISQKSVLSAGCICVLTMDGNTPEHFLNGGRAVERVWLEASLRNIAFQPISQIVFMLRRYEERGSLDFNKYEMQEFAKIREQFSQLLHLPNGSHPIFVFRLLYADQPDIRSLRRPLEKVLFEA